MTIHEALENALTFLESLGYKGGDIHDDLELAKDQIRSKHPTVASEEL